MTFPCTKCGACCRLVGTLDPELDRGDLVCKYLGDDNLCTVYETRPRICRVDELRPAETTTDTWYRLNLDVCDELHLQVYGQERPA